MAKKSASGTGNIRKKVVTRNGKEYEYWKLDTLPVLTREQVNKYSAVSPEKSKKR